MSAGPHVEDKRLRQSQTVATAISSHLASGGGDSFSRPWRPAAWKALL